MLRVVGLSECVMFDVFEDATFEYFKPGAHSSAELSVRRDCWRKLFPLVCRNWSIVLYVRILTSLGQRDDGIS